MNPSLAPAQTAGLVTFLQRLGIELNGYGEPKSRLVSGGWSNLTYEVDLGPHRWILRRPPASHVLESAHDMSREVRAMRALEHSTVPVPRIIGDCDDPSLLGAPFYLMELIPGAVLRTNLDYETVPIGVRAELSRNFFETLADLHLVAPASVGLADFGKPEGFAVRQVHRWNRQLEGSTCREMSTFKALHDALLDQPAPQGRPGITHGDFRLDNIVIDAETGRPRAVLDWEMATLGDTMTDVALTYVYWVGWRGISNPIAGVPIEVEGFCDWETAMGIYENRAGRRVDGMSWYIGFAYYKLAAILEGIYFRNFSAGTLTPETHIIADMVPELLDRGLQSIATSPY